MQQAVKLITDHYKISPEVIFRPTRKTDTLFYRHIFFYLVKSNRKYRNISYREIRDYCFRNHNLEIQCHATLINGIKRVEERMSYDKDYKSSVDFLINTLRDISDESIVYIDEPDMVIKKINLLEMCKPSIAEVIGFEVEIKNPEN